MTDGIQTLVDQALSPACFFVAAPGRLRTRQTPDLTERWELFRGHLLPPEHARQEITCDRWDLMLAEESPAEVPLLSVYHAPSLQQLFVVRRILTHGFEAFESSPGVISSRPTEKWTAELVATLNVDTSNLHRLAAPLAHAVWLAVVGTSRLPITSLESPLPAFSLGRLGYCPGLRHAEGVWRDPIDFAVEGWKLSAPVLMHAKLLETALRGSSDDVQDRLAQAVSRLADGEQGIQRVVHLFRTMINAVALSPYTHFCDRMISLLRHPVVMDKLGVSVVLDLLGWMMRHVCRHLTSFDLRLFHSFGANYPDALFLEALLRAFVEIGEQYPLQLVMQPHDTADEQIAKRMRRRALRQAGLIWLEYQEHRVPDAPTSMGENLRVLPAPFTRVPEEQIQDPGKRRRRLFSAGSFEPLLGPAMRQAWAESVADLEHPAELREMGVGSFLDRPLGLFKEPGAVDRTPLVAHVAFSRMLAGQRIMRLQTSGVLSKTDREQSMTRLKALPVHGVRCAEIASRERPGVVSLSDALKGAPDFVVLRTTSRSLAALLAWYDLHPLAEKAVNLADFLTSPGAKVLVQHVPEGSPSHPRLRLYDQQQQLVLELGFELSDGLGPDYVERWGHELPRRLSVWAVDPSISQGVGSEPAARLVTWIELRDGAPAGETMFV